MHDPLEPALGGAVFVADRIATGRAGRQMRLTLDWRMFHAPLPGAAAYDLPEEIDMANTSESGPNKATASAKVHERTLNGLKESAAQATAGFEQAQAAIASNPETAHTSASNAILVGHDTLGAYAKSTEIWAAGLHDLAMQSAALARSSIAEASEHLKRLAAADFADEAIEMQTRIMRASAEKAVAEAARLANAYIDLTAKAFAPIAAQGGTAAAPGRPANASPPNASSANASPVGLKPHPAERAS